jgi:hypothetical protein
MVPHGQGNLPSGHRRTTSPTATAKISTTVAPAKKLRSTGMARPRTQQKFTSVVIARTAATAMVVMKIVSKILSIMQAVSSDGTNTKLRHPEWFVGNQSHLIELS